MTYLVVRMECSKCDYTGTIVIAEGTEEDQKCPRCKAKLLIVNTALEIPR